MKSALCLVVILLAVVNFPQASPGRQTDPEFDCWLNCEVPLHERIIICTESGLWFRHSCAFNCAKSFPSKYKPEDLIKVDCKPGSYAHCWNTECTEQERKTIKDKKDFLCDKDPPHFFTDWPCDTKCEDDEEETDQKNKSKVEFVPCSGVRNKF